MKLAITGGHHTSALPVIDSFLEDGDVEILWLGHRRSMRGNLADTLEYRDITKRNIPFVDLKAGKFYRTYNPFRLARIPYGFFQALSVLARFKPDVVLSFGGYLAVPVVLAAKNLGIPSITHEQTVVTGYANKLISRFVDKILISHEESREFFPEEKVIYSGIPLRKALFEVRSDSFKFENDLPVLYITAGKTGSHIINSVVQKALPELLRNFNIIHQTGDNTVFNDYNSLLEMKETLVSQGQYYLRKYVLEDEIGEVFSKVDLLLGRSGAHTTYEIREFRVPSVLVPIPWVSHNEQWQNARVLEEAGLALILEERNLTPEYLLEVLEKAREELPQKPLDTPHFNDKATKIIKSEVLKLYEKKA